MRRSVSNLGLLVALLSSALFATSGSFAASLIATGWTPVTAVTARVAIAGLVLTVPALVQLRARPLARSAAPAVVLYGALAVAGTQLCYFNAVAHLSVAVALMIEYSGVLLVVGWGWLRGGRRPRLLTFLGGAIALGGLVLVLDLLGSHHLDGVGVLWGFGAAIGLATYFVLSGTTADVPPLVLAWGGLAVAAVALAGAGAAGMLPLRAAGTDVVLLNVRVSPVVPVLGLALLAAVVPYVAGIAAVRLLGSKLASFVGLTEVLFAVVIAWLLVGQRLDAIQLSGGALVIAGIALVRLDEMREPAGTGPAAGTGLRQPSPVLFDEVEPSSE